jgi:electron transfer flavoprotein alpha subunit
MSDLSDLSDLSDRIVACTWGTGRSSLPAGAEALLTFGRRMGGELRWLHLGALPARAAEVAAQFGVVVLEHGGGAAFERFQPDVVVEALAHYGAPRAPRALLLAQTFDARLVAPRLAGRSNAGVVMNAVGAEGGPPLRITTSAYGGDTRVVYEVAGPCVVGVLTDVVAAEPAAGVAPRVEPFAVSVDGVRERIRVVQAARAEGPKLEDASIVVAGGRGLGKKENFRLVEELAAALGGMAGASRPIVDDGWTDSAHQVGLTGKITRPVLYIAAGISGASQHMVGCAAAKTLVAINKDPDAAIFRYARYGIVGDCLEILPELTRAVKGA